MDNIKLILRNRFLMTKNIIHQIDRKTTIVIMIGIVALCILYWVAANKIVPFFITKLGENHGFGLLCFFTFILFALSEIPLLRKKLFTSQENSLLRVLPIRRRELYYVKFLEKTFENFVFIFINAINFLIFLQVSEVSVLCKLFWSIGLLFLLPTLTSIQFLLTIGCHFISLRVKRNLLYRKTRVKQSSLTWNRMTNSLHFLSQDVRSLVTKDIILFLRQSFAGFVLISFILVGLSFFSILNNKEWITSIVISLILIGILLITWVMLIFDQMNKELPYLWILKVVPLGWRKLWIGKFLFAITFVVVITPIISSFFAISYRSFYPTILSFSIILLLGIFLCYFAVAFAFVNKSNPLIGQISYLLFLVTLFASAFVIPPILLLVIPIGILMFRRGVQCST